MAAVRWDAQRLDAEEPATLPGMPTMRGLLRSVQVPEFPGLTFHEVRSKSALNEVPGDLAMPFRWTINPYRGCSHACVYCYARSTHQWLELDTGRDFDSQVVVKTNLVDVLRRELARPSWEREHVALGTNTDPYQRAEGRYRLMPGVISALAGSGTPFSILTKGTLLRRDLPVQAVPGQQRGYSPGQPAAVLRRDGRAAALELLVARHQLRVLAAQPGGEPLPGAGAQVQRHHRHPRGTGGGDRAHRGVQVGQPVSQPGQHRREEDAARQAGVGQRPDQVEACPRGRNAGLQSVV